MVLVGKCLVLGGMTLLGLRHAGGLRSRVHCLGAFLGAVERAQRELAFSLPPVEELLHRMGEGLREPVGKWFLDCCAAFRQRREECLEEIWTRRLREADLPLREADLDLLNNLGGLLGRFDGESQEKALGQIHARLEEQLAGAREDAQRLGKVYATLGITLGLFCVILL